MFQRIRNVVIACVERKVPSALIVLDIVHWMARLSVRMNHCYSILIIVVVLPDTAAATGPAFSQHLRQ